MRRTPLCTNRFAVWMRSRSSDVASHDCKSSHLAPRSRLVRRCTRRTSVSCRALSITRRRWGSIGSRSCRPTSRRSGSAETSCRSARRWRSTKTRLTISRRSSSGRSRCTPAISSRDSSRNRLTACAVCRATTRHCAVMRRFPACRATLHGSQWSSRPTDRSGRVSFTGRSAIFAKRRLRPLWDGISARFANRSTSAPTRYACAACAR